MKGLRKSWRPGDKFLIRYRDEHLVVVEKAAGLLTVPNIPSSEFILLEWMELFLIDRGHSKVGFKPTQGRFACIRRRMTKANMRSHIGR